MIVYSTDVLPSLLQWDSVAALTNERDRVNAFKIEITAFSVNIYFPLQNYYSSLGILRACVCICVCVRAFGGLSQDSINSTVKSSTGGNQCVWINSSCQMSPYNCG